MAKKNDDVDFEKALAELESIVEKMEHGDLGLDESLKQFERGIALTRACQKALSEAEQKVRILMDKAGRKSLEPFNPQDAQED